MMVVHDSLDWVAKETDFFTLKREESCLLVMLVLLGGLVLNDHQDSGVSGLRERVCGRRLRAERRGMAGDDVAGGLVGVKMERMVLAIRID